MSAPLRGTYGMPFVKFTLTFDGSLPASANKAKNQSKWDIRQRFDPQLRDLWGSNPALRELERDGRYFPEKGETHLRQAHHGSVQERVWRAEGQNYIIPGTIDLCAPINMHGAWFRPLIRETFALHCGLKILFLRKERPGRIYQGGDIDGRIKTLLDALTMPQHVEQVLGKTDKNEPIFCLLEDDSMVSGLQVETERLLTDENHPADFARLTIEVDVRVRQTMIYNQLFL
jgi:hypothetical protein